MSFEITVERRTLATRLRACGRQDRPVRLIARKDNGGLLGAHLVGEESSVLIQPLLRAMSFGMRTHSHAASAGSTRH